MILQNCKINGKIDAKPSKSIFQRLLALSLLSSNPILIDNPSFCDDSIAVLNMIKSIGCDVDTQDNKIRITPGRNNLDLTLNCNESALAIRMFSPILALFENKYKLIAEKTLQKRKLFEIESILSKLGATVKTNFGFPPIQIQGPISAENIILDASDTSQFLTGLLISLPKLDRESIIEVSGLSSKPYIDITIDLISKFGGKIVQDTEDIFICYPSDYTGGRFVCENDWSNAAVFLIAGAIGGTCEVAGLDLDSKQGDKVVVEILRFVGAQVEIKPNSIKVDKSNLNSFEFSAKNHPDLVPNLCVLALNCNGRSKIYDIERLRLKEIDRLEKILRVFNENNLKITYQNNCLEIQGSDYSIDYLNAENDHRFAMVAALLSINNPKPLKVINHQAISKSYPEFWIDFNSIQFC